MQEQSATQKAGQQRGKQWRPSDCLGAGTICRNDNKDMYTSLSLWWGMCCALCRCYGSAPAATEREFGTDSSPLPCADLSGLLPVRQMKARSAVL
jgi:hypothetical protein